MRALGFVFVVLLIVAAVGYLRGWFSVTTTHAGGTSGVTLGVDNDKIGADAKAAGAELGALSAKAAEKVADAAGRSKATDLEGTLGAVDVLGRHVSLTVESKTVELHVPASASITRDGTSVGLAGLRPADRVRVSFAVEGSTRTVSAIEVLN